MGGYLNLARVSQPGHERGLICVPAFGLGKPKTGSLLHIYCIYCSLPATAAPSTAFSSNSSSRSFRICIATFLG